MIPRGFAPRHASAKASAMSAVALAKAELPHTSLAGTRQPRSARVGSLARLFKPVAQRTARRLIIW
jgi:hypothetical protein